MADHARIGHTMSNGMSDVPEPVRNLLDLWTAGLVQVVESMADQKPEISWESADAPPPDEDLLWWEQPFQILPGMLVWVATPHATWEYAGTLTLKAAGLETVEANEARNTWLEILGQSLSVLARSIGAVLGREVTCETGAERGPDATPDVAASIALSFGETPLAPLWIGFSAKLTAVVSHPAACNVGSGAGAPEDDDSMPVDRRPSAAAAHSYGGGVPPTMDLLLDVELPVSISFGRTEILMKDVLKLTTGSIVELNRGVSEPVEVLVNHCLIARGEVVVVEGNYGVRIQQIVSRSDRLRSVR
jgi:flagellar motor switch protein FliN/FliY